MPLDNEQKRRILAIRDGVIAEYMPEGNTRTFDRLREVHLVNITFKKIETPTPSGGKEYKGDVVQLHLIDQEDYFILDLWMGSYWSMAFFKMMEGIDHTMPLTFKVQVKVQDGKRRPALFLSQDGLALRWNYTANNMGDLPRADPKEVDGKTIWDTTMQQVYFIDKVEAVILPALQKKKHPFPYHPLFRGIVGNGVAGGYFGEDRKGHTIRNAASKSELNYGAPKLPDFVDDLPF